jgi:hypothetical protein
MTVAVLRCSGLAIVMKEAATVAVGAVALQEKPAGHAASSPASGSAGAQRHAQTAPTAAKPHRSVISKKRCFVTNQAVIQRCTVPWGRSGVYAAALSSSSNDVDQAKGVTPYGPVDRPICLCNEVREHADAISLG